MLRLLFLLFASLSPLGSAFRRENLREVYAWKWVDYVYPNTAMKNEDIRSGVFIPNATLPLGLERWRDKLFVTVPRGKKGVPASLGYVNVSNTARSPPLIPYPDWETNRLPSDKEPAGTVHIISTYRIRADACDRLWIIDSGLVNGEKVSPPQILIYDLHTDKLIRNYFFKDEDYEASSWIANIAVDVTSTTCDDAFAYIPDLGGFSLIVYSFKANTSWRVSHHYFHFDPLRGNYRVGGQNFQWTDGVFGVVLSKIQKDGFRILFFHSLSSQEQFAVSTKFLRDETAWKSNFNQFIHIGSRGPDSQATGNYYHEKTGIIFYPEIQNHAITCWNTNKKLEGNVDIIVQDPLANDFIYPSDIRADDQDYLWFLNNNLPIFVYGEFDINKYNSFVFKAPIHLAVRRTKCDPITVPAKLY